MTLPKPIPVDLFYGNSLPQEPEVSWFLKRKSMRRRVLTDDEERVVTKKFWAVFPKQQIAFDYADTVPYAVHAFAFQPANLNGSYRYVVTTYDHLFEKLESTKEGERHMYEIIRDNRPCCLYFDLEFGYDCNPRRNGDEMVRCFKRLLCAALNERFHPTPAVNSIHIIDLDSTTSSKFSCHLIVRHRSIVFRDNRHVGLFVESFCDEIKRNAENDAELRSLFVQQSENCCSLFVDLGVYSRNRLFRTFLSSKLSKQNEFRISTRNEYAIVDTKSFLLASLVSNVAAQAESVIELAPPPPPPTLFQSGSTTTAMSSPPTSFSSSGGAFNSAPVVLTSNSPYPLVDRFIGHSPLLKLGGAQGRVRRCCYFPVSKTILYEIAENRFCANVGRAHKSNNIYIVCDLAKRMYYQKCHDIDCKHFKSNVSLNLFARFFFVIQAFRIYFDSTEKALPIPDDIDPFAFNNHYEEISDELLLAEIAKNPSLWL